MPTAVIDAEGTEIFFTDSGPVEGSSDYTTYVMYHGSAFTGDMFHKLLPFAANAKDNVRLVILNRRDYVGSSKYSDAELEDLNAGRKVFMERTAVEVGNFLAWFIEKNQIPRITSDGKSGGLAVGGWSIGSATPLSLFGHPEAVPKELYAKLEPYFRLLIFYDPPHLTFGYEQPPEGYNPWTDPDFPTPLELFDNFRYWVSGYYEHAGLPSRDGRRLNFAKRGERPSVDNMTPEEYAKNFDGIAASRCEFPMYFPMQPVLKEQAEKALFDEETVSRVLPRVKVVLQTCTSANWYCAYGFIETERRYKEYVAKGVKVRPIQFQEIEGANHFIHWDDPVKFWTATAKAINGL